MSAVPNPYEQALAERTAHHKHNLSPIDDYTRPDDVRIIHRRCVCGLEEKREYENDVSPFRVTYRFGGIWLDPLDLLRINLPVQVCPDCHGEPQLEECGRCEGLMIVDVVTAERLPGPGRPPKRSR